MDNQLEIIVVGLSHYISKDSEVCDAWARAQTEGTIVTFEWEPENAYTPGLAFKAYVGLQLVGYAGKDFCYKLLPLKDEEGIVQGRLKYGEHKMLRVEVSVPQGVTIPVTPHEAQAAISTQPSLFPQGQNLPHTETESRLKQILRQLRIAPSAELLQSYVTYAHRTLSNEVLSNLYPLYQQHHEQLPEQAEAAYDLHKDLGIGPQLPYELWQNLMSDLRSQAQATNIYDRWANYLWGEDARNPKPDQLTQAKQKLEHWLEQLPHAIWRTYHNDELQWAQMLYYQQPSREDLYRICTHWLVLEFVNSLIPREVENPSVKNQPIARPAIETETETETTSTTEQPTGQATEQTTEQPNEQPAMPWEPVLTDPDGLFDKRRSLRQIYDGLKKASLLIRDQGDWGLVAVALGEDEGIQAFCADRLPLKAFTALLVNWGLVSKENQNRTYNNIKRRSSDYQKAGNASASKAVDTRYELWNERVEQFMACFD